MSNPTLLSGKSRDLLKITLRLRRGVFSRKNGRKYPICPFCDKPLIDIGDLHEALISKGQIRGHAQSSLINSRFNCIERHHDSGGCSHTGGIGGDEAFEKAARYLAKWEGEKNVRNWLIEMCGTFPQVGKEALQRFNSVFPEE
jgi:hypothetical protein